jgi:3',5'-nucleoside bisphosphate phosphatase
VQAAAQGSGLVVLPGMEVQSREEVHILCLFETLEQLAAWQTQVDAALPDLSNHPDFFGEQLVVDAEGEFIRIEPRLLLTSTRFSIDEIYERVNQIGGLVIPAHVERTSNGLFPILGLVSASWPVEAFEISRHCTPESARAKFPGMGATPLIQSGDVHSLEAFLGATYFTLETRSLAEIRQALRAENGRRVEIRPPKED